MSYRPEMSGHPAAWWITGLLVILVVGIFVFSPSLQRYAYPIHYREEIWQAAETHHVSPYLVAAVIQTESKYQSGSVSKKGAIGLMQLMPETAAWSLELMGYSKESLAYIEEPSLNIEVGSWYLHWLIKRYDGNLIAAVAAYNAGQSVVDRWMKEQLWPADLDAVSEIPYPETRQYVKRVLYYYDKYQRIYEKEHEPLTSAENPYVGIK